VSTGGTVGVKERRPSGEAEKREREQEMKRIALVRNHNSSGDFHLKGW